MKRTLKLAVIAIACLVAGCANEPVAPGNGVAAVAQAQQEPIADPQPEKSEGIGDKFSDLVEQAKSKAPSLDDMKKMIGSAGDATGQTADDTMKWANEMYKSLSESGMTTTTNVKDWVAEDWSNINAWEYQVVTVESAQLVENPGILQEKMNEAGKLRWECFHVSDGPGATMFYFKRRKRSYMKNLPLKDMLKLVPLLDSGGEQ
ncbi:hypothetical protein [Mariniblastus fucicola]|uniref:Lipoprotein n=1 Tax=Mariniblastus fucicola TaxID=980251 RepID=A0A5B9PGI4_9BACT|nr:hypothetical protein [Mariniblastus fucicola]QEG23872.1 hypothetical protein MFFC18_37760 [Mariniblastus fucicola]